MALTRFFAAASILCGMMMAAASAYANTAPTKTCHPGYMNDGNGNCVVIAVPANAHVKQNEWICNPGFVREGDQCARIALPANAEIWGNGWRCKAGFRDNRQNGCDAIKVPVNGYIKGDNWACHIGYRKVDDRCEQFTLPLNAVANESDFGWKCLPGFFNNGNNGCDQIALPDNAHIDGNKWACDAGYIRYNNACQKQDVPTSAVAAESKTGWSCLPGYRATDDGQCDVVIAPDYAYVQGDAWVCLPGYLRDGDQCVQNIIPAHATATSTGWKCNPGFYDNGDGACAAVAAPLNAYIKDAEWFCRPGYLRDGDTCVTIAAPVNATATSTGWRCNPGFFDNGDGACAPIQN